MEPSRRGRLPGKPLRWLSRIGTALKSGNQPQIQQKAFNIIGSPLPYLIAAAASSLNPTANQIIDWSTLALAAMVVLCPARRADGDRVLTVSEAARELGRSPQTIRYYIRSGKLNARKVGRVYQIKAKEISRYKRENRH